MVATSAKTKSGVESGTRAVGTKVTQRELKEIQGLIEAGVYISISDFVREAIRDKLRVVKVVKVRDRAYDEAKRVLFLSRRSSSGLVGTKRNG
jgi:Arc/MetJ-type ribon-helix-helix transcriptional regulator